MILFIECLIAIALFSAIVVPMTAKDPIGVISDYPPAIRKRCVELGLTIAGLSDRRIGGHASGMIFKMAEALEKSKVFFYT